MKIGSIYNYNYIRNYSNLRPKQENAIKKSSTFSFGKTEGGKLFYLTRENSQDLNNDIYFIRMRSYKTQDDWANEMVKGTYDVANEIKRHGKFEKVAKMAEETVSQAYYKIKKVMGLLIYRKRTLTPFSVENDNERGSEYYDTYKSLFQDGKVKYEPKSNEEYKDANVCAFFNEGSAVRVCEGWCHYESKNLELASKEYKKLFSPELETLPKEEQEEKINRIVATIHWLIAQESPWARGSDSIANLITKSIYLAKNMEISPVKEGISLDFEAWYRDLEDFIKAYSTFFEKAPKKIK